MKGILLVNHFLSGEHFMTVQELFLKAAREKGIELSVKTAVDCMHSSLTAEDVGDFVLFWDKDVLLAKRLAALGLPVFNSAEAVRLCDNKGETALALAAHGVSTPRTVIAPMTFEGIGYTKTDFVKKACDVLGFPLVIKELYGSFGAQVYLINDEAEALARVAAMGGRPFLFQAFVQESFGRDVRANVVGDRVVAAMLRTGKSGDFRSNIGSGGQGETFLLSPEGERLAVAAARAVGADFAGVDLLFTADGFTVCEVNSNPQFAGTMQYTGINMAEHILAHVQTKI